MKALCVKILGFALAGTLFGCSRQAVERQRLADGTFMFKCESNLSACLSKVDEVCKGSPYVVHGGWDEPKVAGVDQYQVESHRSQVHVRCVTHDELEKNLGPKPASTSTVRAAPSATEAPKAVTAPSPAPIASARTSCVPGATQACVGPAACSGGQACLADGSGFAPCDCGSP